MRNQQFVGVNYIWGFLSLVLAAALSACGTEPEENKGPEIVGCKSVAYHGMVWGTRCETGLVSYSQSSSMAGKSASFRISCSGGCVSGVTAG